MATKNAQEKTHKLTVKIDKGDDEKKKLAKIGLSPEFQATAAIISLDDSYDINHLLDELIEQKNEVIGGDMKRAEAMLISQATTLEKLFTAMTRKALSQDYMKHYESFMRLGLKAQAQCRQTLETLSNIKNPPVVFAKQANIANGPQQVNNGAPVQATRAEEIENKPNELLEVQYGGETLDTRSTSAAIGQNQAMATVG